jgi:hypothetical protein
MVKSNTGHWRQDNNTLILTWKQDAPGCMVQSILCIDRVCWGTKTGRWPAEIDATKES